MTTPELLKSAPSLPTGTDVGVVGLTVSNLDRSLRFYENALGLRRLDRSDGTALLGSASTPLLELVERPGAPPKPPGATGLFHFALLLPSRRDLGRIMRHLLDVDYPLDGAADHLVSEALYLSDPDRIGIELYRDRPRSEWRIEAGQVRMASDPLDFRGILNSAGEDEPWSEIAPDTIMGHVHLQVGDIARAGQFYAGVVGFDAMAQLPGALFVSAGGYHHHLGLNTWQSRNGSPAPEAAGLRYFTIYVPDSSAREALAARLDATGATVERDRGTVRFRDPWGNGILVQE